MDKGRVKPDTGLNLREKPNGELVSVLRHNEVVDILEEVTFFRVRNALGDVGYVHGGFLEKMPAIENRISSTSTTTVFPSDTYEQVTFQNDYFIGEAAKVDRDFVPALTRIGVYAKTCQVKVWVTSSTRNLGDQVRGAIVPPASQSCHHVGHAIDMNLMFEGKLFNAKKLKRDNLSNLPSAIGKLIDKIREDGGLRWGGDFNTEDPVHIDDDLYHRQEIMYMAKLHSRVKQLNAWVS